MQSSEPNPTQSSIPSAPEPERAGSVCNTTVKQAIDRRTLRLLAVVAVGLPALLCLTAMDVWRYLCLSEDSWFLAGEFKATTEDGLWLQSVFTRLNEHWLVPCKVALFGALQWLPHDVERLACIAWLSVLFVTVMAVRESRSWLQDRSKLHVLSVWLTLALFVFSLKQTYALLWEACFFLHFPLVALALMIGLFKRDFHWAVRVFGAAIIGAASVFSFGMGVVSVWAVFPVIWFGGGRAPIKTSIVWFMVAICLTVLQFSGVGSIHSDRTSLVRLAEQPMMAVQFALAMLGGPLAGGTSFEPINQAIAIGTAGVFLLVISCWALWRRRDTPGFIRSAAPWLAWCLFGFGAVALVTAGRLSPNLGIPLTGRYVALALPFGVGLFVLSSLLWGQSRRFPFVALLVGSLLVLNWQSGALEMRYWTAKNRQEAASVALVPFLPLHSLPRIQVRGAEQMREVVAFLRERDVLRRVPELAGIELDNFKLRSELTPSQANFDSLHALVDGWAASGRAFLPLTGRPPDLVLLTFEADGMAPRVIDTAMPNLPPDYFDNATRLRQNRDFYNGWHRIIPRDRVPAHTAGWVRAWAWDVEANRLFPMTGRHRLDPNASTSTAAR